MAGDRERYLTSFSCVEVYVESRFQISHSCMKSEDVLQIVTWLEQAEIPVWLDGGWGVDTLVGQQTRSHSDLDLVVSPLVSLSR